VLFTSCEMVRALSHEEFDVMFSFITLLDTTLILRGLSMNILFNAQGTTNIVDKH